MKVIVQWAQDYGRMGDLDGVFVCEKDLLEKLKGHKVYASDVLGKHSEIPLVLDDESIEIKSEDQDFIEKFVEIVGDRVGFDVLGYVQDDYEYEHKGK